MTKEVMKQALDVLKSKDTWGSSIRKAKEDAIKALEEALKQEQGEPVAMRYDFDGYGYKYIDSGSGSDWQTREKGAEPLYEQTKEWVGLTDQDMNEPKTHNFDFILGARWAEEILKDRNK